MEFDNKTWETTLISIAAGPLILAKSAIILQSSPSQSPTFSCPLNHKKTLFSPFQPKKYKATIKDRLKSANYWNSFPVPKEGELIESCVYFFLVA